MARFGIGRGTTIVLGAALVALLVTFLALRDVAGRLDAPRDGATQQAASSPQLMSAFKEGPRLGDLRGLFLQAAEEEPPAVISGSTSGGASTSTRTTTSSDDGSVSSQQRVEVTGGGSFTFTQRSSTSGRSDGNRARERQRDRSTDGGGSDLCGLPAMC